MKIKLLLITALSLLLCACASNPYHRGGTGSLYQLQSIHAHWHTGSRTAQALTQIRIQALKETAMSLGARAGLAYRSRQIDTILHHEEPELGATFNFYGLLLHHDILPPVLVQAQNTLNLAGPDAIRLAQRVYKIEQQAHFVTAPPTWRSYLWMDYPEPAMPNHTLLPKNTAEQQAWNQYVATGWHNGIDQANNIFSANLARLRRDYRGMVLYRKMYVQNMVSSPYVAKTDLGITGNASEMRINDQVLRITALPRLNLDGNTWRPVVVHLSPLTRHQTHLLALLHPKMTARAAWHNRRLAASGGRPLRRHQ